MVFAQLVLAVRFSDSREFLKLLNTYWLLKEYQTYNFSRIAAVCNVGKKWARYGLLDKPKPDTTERKPVTANTLFIRVMQ
jgi:hypothetical protein